MNHISSDLEMDSDSLLEDGDFPPALFCRAKYPYVAQDASALSFSTGDIIEVLTQQPSGWWDGLLGEERGWFPSNYVEIVDLGEIEGEGLGMGIEPSDGEGEQGQGRGEEQESDLDMEAGMVDMGQALGMGMGDAWMEEPPSISAAASTSVSGASGSAADFWMPQVASNGQIFYINTKTGQQSRDLPTDENGDDNLLELGATNTAPDTPSFGLFRRSNTPEPWTRKLADDGLSYYYLNKVDGRVVWTRPDPDLEEPASRPRTPNTAVPPSAPRPISVYSDTSEIHPAPASASASAVSRGHSSQGSTGTATAVDSGSYVNGSSYEKATTDPSAQLQQLQLQTLSIAQSLQQSLLPAHPSPSPSVYDLSAEARRSIRRIVDAVGSGGLGVPGMGVASPTRDDLDLEPIDQETGSRKMDVLINAVVLAVRNLLYVANAVPGAGHGHSHSSSRDQHHSHSHHSSSHDRERDRSPLKPSQRKVTATLSRLVLSARAITYDSGAVSYENTLERISGDAEELERAVRGFEGDVRRLTTTGSNGIAGEPRGGIKPLPTIPSTQTQVLKQKHLFALFDPDNIGLGLPGAGRAGAWTGFGYVRPRGSTKDKEKAKDKLRERSGSFASAFDGFSEEDEDQDEDEWDEEWDGDESGFDDSADSSSDVYDADEFALRRRPPSKGNGQANASGRTRPRGPRKGPRRPLTSPTLLPEVREAIDRLGGVLGGVLAAVSVSSPNLASFSSGSRSEISLSLSTREVLRRVQVLVELVGGVDVSGGVPYPPTCVEEDSSRSTTSMNGTGASLSTADSSSSSSSSISSNGTVLNGNGSTTTLPTTLAHSSSSTSLTSNSTLPNGKGNGSGAGVNTPTQTQSLTLTLLRTLENALQAVYDDSASLWVEVGREALTNSIGGINPHLLKLDMITVLCTSIKANAGVVGRVLERLVGVAGAGASTSTSAFTSSYPGTTLSTSTSAFSGSPAFSSSQRRISRVPGNQGLVPGLGQGQGQRSRASVMGGRPMSVVRVQQGGLGGPGAPHAQGFVDLSSSMSSLGSLESTGENDEYGYGGGYGAGAGAGGGDDDDQVGLEDAFGSRPMRRFEPNRYQPQSPDSGYGLGSVGAGAPPLQQSISSSAIPTSLQPGAKLGMGMVASLGGLIQRNASAPNINVNSNSSTSTPNAGPGSDGFIPHSLVQQQIQNTLSQTPAQLNVKRVEGYNQRNGMGYTGQGNIVGDAYVNRPNAGPNAGAMSGGAGVGGSTSASSDEDGYAFAPAGPVPGSGSGFEDDDLVYTDDEMGEDGVGGFVDDGFGFGDDPITPKPTSSGKGASSSGAAAKISNKAAKILGEEAPPWFLLPAADPNAGELIPDSDKSVKGGTVAALVERLTAHDTTDPNYSKAFLMTFKSFTTLNELFDLLVQRFRIQPPPGLSVLELRQWSSKKKSIVQFRVINTFKSMLTDEDILEKDDLYILARMKEFVLSEDVAQITASKPLANLIDRVQKSGETKRIVVKAAQTAPTPIVPKSFTTSSKKLKLTDIDPLELARQLTLFESALYQKIRPMECLQRAREQKSDTMDNIAFVIQTSNRIADWVAESVLSKEDSRKRAATVKHLILVADRCRTLNNFSTMIAIVSGLNTPPIRRLKRTWEQVSQRHMAQFGACEVTLDSNRNFNKYRSMLATVVPPCVPFIGVFLSTLQFIQDGNKDLISEGIVNFKKRQMASEVISDIKRWQAHSYNFQVVPVIREYIEESLASFDDTRMSSDRFWQMSLEREPREREDEKMARLLQESGFL